ncbi:hypothetical protein PVAND_000737 [Polypedilum vanderplanki]|uniref:N-acetyltransferase domain-containing protein n=1 Tax=Polypedilum vanderplanki TaxID=319348 RepID=A0A9J6BLY5_POLVA|nr:hypothetical protein PVAND_000737 [Polypedilum vanderplanki]
MCFLTNLIGCTIESITLQKKSNHKKEFAEKYCKVQPIHKRQDLLDETIKLINSFWPKTRAERLSILGSSKDDPPLSLIMTFSNKNSIIKCSQSGKQVNVIGHLRLIPVPADSKACFIESMIIHQEFRGKGLGSYFIKQAEKFCEETLHLKSIFLSTFDSGEFYMKIGFELTNAICVYGNGEVNNVSKKIYLKKTLNYVEPEPVEEEEIEIYDPNKDYNYLQQKQMENDIIVGGFPFKIDRAKSFIDKICEILNFPLSFVKYYYSYELMKRETGLRSFHLMISCVTYEAKMDLLTRFDDFGIMSFQHFFEKPVNEWDNTLITHSERYTNLNYIILKELAQLKLDRWISDYMYINCQFQAKQNDTWITVKNLEIIELLKTPELPDLPDETIHVWDDVKEEIIDPAEHFEKMRQSLKQNENEESWITVLRRSSLENTRENSLKKHSYMETNSWTDKVRYSNEALTLGFSDF